ncbi:MAG: O-methyltransferase [Planctomycetes bacterium]|nr:O-methyltransferase [Planctomycetota bacterium]
MSWRKWFLAVSLLAGGLAAGLFGVSGLAVSGMKDEPEVKDLDAFLKELYGYGLKNNMWNVRPADGKFLQLMVSAAGAKKVLELGTANGYSGIWIGRGLRETGGSLTTIELNVKKAQEAKANFAKVGMASMVQVLEGDAAKIVPTLKSSYDLIFMDTEKGDYLEQFRLAFPLLKPGGVFMAHNAILMRDSMKDFLKEVEEHPELTTVVVQTSDDGFSVSYRKAKK